MSTRVSIKYEVDDETGCGFHLFDDVFDSFDEGANPPVYLELIGVNFEAVYASGHGGSIVVTIPREWAIKLGLVPNDKAQGSAACGASPAATGSATTEKGTTCK